MQVQNCQKSLEPCHSDIFFCAEHESGLHFRIFFELPVQKSIFCQFQRKNAFFGYSESTVVPWQKVSIKPNKNCSRYTVYKNLAAIQSSQIVKNRPKMGQISPKRHFFQKYQSYSEFFSQSHSIQSEIGQIYALRALNADTRVIKGQKQAKNWLHWPKSAFSSDRSLLFQFFWPISLNPVITSSNIPIESFEH